MLKSQLGPGLKLGNIVAELFRLNLGTRFLAGLSDFGKKAQNIHYVVFARSEPARAGESAFIRGQDDFRIALAAIGVIAKLSAQFQVIVDFAVEDNLQMAIVIFHRLPPGIG